MVDSSSLGSEHASLARHSEFHDEDHCERGWGDLGRRMGLQGIVAASLYDLPTV